MRWLLLALLIVFAGCISPPKQIGCCLQENLDEGCMLYNTTTFTAHDFIAETIGLCDDNASGTLGGCNVTIDGDVYFVPICTEDQIVPCVNGNCTAMVCGDFKYQPKIVPTFTSTEDSEGDVPPNSDDTVAMNFYNSQCRFLPMDATLRQIMKNSKSQINVFRIGVGGSFDEFDQYRNFFPISDQFCSTNPYGRVDRFMNYLSWESGQADEFDPIGEFESICIDDNDIPGPFTFSEDSEERDSTVPNGGGGMGITYNTVVPDESNYKFAHYAVVDLQSYYHTNSGGYYSYGNPFVNQENIYKKIDKGFYRRELAIAHQETIFGNDGDTRAPFECSMSEYDCYSGSCDTSTYNRGVMVEASEDFETNPFELVTDCNEIFDQNGQKKVVCAPTESVSFNEGSPPSITSADVEYYPARIEVEPEWWNLYSFESLTQDIDPILAQWDEMTDMDYVRRGRTFSGYSTLDELYFEMIDKKDCRDYDTNNDTTDVLCSHISYSSKHPRAAGIEFFGKFKDGSTVRMPDGSVIIGYAITDNDDFGDLEFVEQCELSFNSSDPYIDNNFQLGLEAAACTTYCEARADEASSACTGSTIYGDYYYANDADCVEAHRNDPEFFDRCTQGYMYSRPECLQRSGVGGSYDVDQFNNCMNESDPYTIFACANYQNLKDDAFDGCVQDCVDYCSNSDQNKCEDFCTDGIAGNEGGVQLNPCFLYGENSTECLNYVPQQPLQCNVPGGSNPSSAVVSDDFYRIDFTRPGNAVWETMMTAFRPYFEDKVANGILMGGFSDGCGGYLQGEDAIFSSIPWIVSYNKSIWDGGHLLYSKLHLSAPYAQALRERNLYDREIVNTAGTSSCELRFDAMHPSMIFFADLTEYYDIAFSRYMYVFRYEPGSEHIGRCAVDDSTYLPVIKTFGWCDACTTSTLAYQRITADDEVYMPTYKANVDGSSYTDPETICSIKYDYGFSGIGFEVTDNVTCFNPYITDIDQYKESIAGVGSPRTNPEASILKERLGNYMKSGILPIIDMSANSNWNITNPNGGASFSLWWFSFDFGSEDEYLQYDFERLFGDMGASVVIVDRLSSPPDINETEAILARASIVRENCFGCMAAIQVDNTENVEEFRDIIEPVLSHPTASYNLDLVTIDYELSEHTDIDPSSNYTVVDDIAAYGRASLTTPAPGRGKPVLVTKFNVRDDDSRWGDSDYADLFTEIVNRQDELIKAGVIGLIYSPVREDEVGSTNIGDGLWGIIGAASAANEGKGIVTVGSDGVGEKGAKFCAMQEAMYRMTVSPPTTVFTKMLAVENVTCERCVGLDKTLGECGLTCSNGNDCTLPEGATDPNNYKCPDNSLPGECTLCSDVGGSFSCEKTYANGSVEYLNGQMSNLNSDLYMDIIGGLPDGERCCLEDATGLQYSYYANTQERAINKPVVFPKTGDPNMDCGMGDANDVTKLTTFCSIETVPIKEYKIECEIS